MEYSIKKLAKLAGVSTRTLRYYDEIKLLSPERISSNDYRVYRQKEVDRLQQILFYRELVHLHKIIYTPIFKHIGGVLSRIWFTNASTMVTKIL